MSIQNRNYIKKVLLVGTPYDAHLLEEAGFRTKNSDGDSFAPEYQLARTTEQASLSLSAQQFDMLVADTSFASNSNWHEQVEQFKARNSKMHCAQISTQEEQEAFKPIPKMCTGIEQMYFSNRNPQALRALIQLYNDEMQHEYLLNNNQAFAILVVDHDPNFYSPYMANFYRGLRQHVIDMLPSNKHPTSEWEPIPARPLLILRNDYESALQFVERFHKNILVLFTESNLEINGTLSNDAGLRLIMHLKSLNYYTPALMQSYDETNREAAVKIGGNFLSKQDPMLRQKIRGYLEAFCGLGPFTFKIPGFESYGQAHNLQELRNLTESIPQLVFEFHALHNHFSSWLSMHGYGPLSVEVRKLFMHDANSRKQLLALFDKTLSSQPQQQ